MARSDNGEQSRVLEPLGDDPSIPAMIQAASDVAVGSEVRVAMRSDRPVVELCDVAPGRNGTIRVTHAEVNHAAAMLDPAVHMPVSLGANHLMPIEQFTFDVFIHRRIVRRSEPAASILAAPVGIDRIPNFGEATRIPIEAVMRPVASPRLASRASAAGAAYLLALQRVAMAQQSDMRDYEVHRINLPHPLLFSTVLCQFEIDGRRTGCG